MTAKEKLQKIEIQLDILQARGCNDETLVDKKKILLKILFPHVKM